MLVPGSARSYALVVALDSEGELSSVELWFISHFLILHHDILALRRAFQSLQFFALSRLYSTINVTANYELFKGNIIHWREIARLR